MFTMGNISNGIKIIKSGVYKEGHSKQNSIFLNPNQTNKTQYIFNKHMKGSSYIKAIPIQNASKTI